MPRMDRNGGACGHRRAGGPARGNTLGRDPNLKSEIPNLNSQSPASAAPASRPQSPASRPQSPAPPPSPFHQRTRAAIREVLARKGVRRLKRRSVRGDAAFPPLDRVAPWAARLGNPFAAGVGGPVDRGLDGPGGLVAILVYNLYLLVITLQVAGRSSSAGGRRRAHRDNCWASPNWTSMRFTPRPAGCWRPATGWRRPVPLCGGAPLARPAGGNRVPAVENEPRLFGGFRRAGCGEAPFRRLTLCFEPIVYGGQSATMAATEEMARTMEGLFMTLPWLSRTDRLLLSILLVGAVLVALLAWLVQAPERTGGVLRALDLLQRRLTAAKAAYEGA